MTAFVLISEPSLTMYKAVRPVAVGIYVWLLYVEEEQK